jgi:hypothetical protein
MKKFQDLLMNGISEEITGTKIERLIEVKRRFEAEMIYNGRVPCPKYIQDWLQGLCNTISIPFTDYDIIDWWIKVLGRPMKPRKGNKDKGLSEEEKLAEKYWPQCALTLFHMLYD